MPSAWKLGGSRQGSSSRNPRSDLTFTEVVRALEPEDEDDGYEPTRLERVYFLLDREACQIKIGWTRDLDRRKRQIEHERGRPMELLGVLPGGYDLERSMHAQFGAYRREGREWYSSEIIGAIAPLLA